MGIRSAIGPILLAVFFAGKASASYRITLGGYVPFPSSIQESKDGSLNTFSFAPAVGTGTSIPLEEFANNFSPELGIVFHKSGAGNDYEKSTFYLLGDMEVEWGSSWFVRYGLGLFATMLDGKGGTVLRENGDEFIEFQRPSKNVITYNISLNLGWDYYFFSRWFVRMEAFAFSVWDSRARDMGYMLVLGYKAF